MTNQGFVPTVAQLKTEAKNLRASLERSGRTLTHSQSLELVAHGRGYRDWNTLHAAAGNGGPPRLPQPGERARGRYLGQDFSGEVIGTQHLAGGMTRLTIKFDTAVDVVTHDSFSSFRHRVNVTVDDAGRSPQKTSNGEPHIVLDL